MNLTRTRQEHVQRQNQKETYKNYNMIITYLNLKIKYFVQRKLSLFLGGFENQCTSLKPGNIIKT